MRLSVFAGRAEGPLALMDAPLVPRRGEKLRLQSKAGTLETYIVDDAVWLIEQGSVQLLVSPFEARKPVKAAKRR